MKLSLRAKIGYNYSLSAKWVLMFFCFFPFVGPIASTNVQPFAFLIAVYILLRHNARMNDSYNKIYEIMLILLSVVVVPSLTSVPFAAIIKRLFSYASIWVIPMAVYREDYDLYGREFQRHVKIFIWIWFWVAIVQTFIYKAFLSFLVPSHYGGYLMDSTRGVISLASEPSFYGYMCFFFLLFILDFVENKSFYLVLVLIQSCILARSTVGIAYIVIFFILFAVGNLLTLTGNRMMFAILISECCIAGVEILRIAYKNSRLGILINALLTDSISLLSNDQSVKERTSGLVESFSNGLLPSPFGEKIIMSGYGGIWFDLGVLAVIFFLFFLYVIKKAYRGVYGMVMPLTITICMFSAINLSAPIFSFYLGYCMLREKQKGYNNRSALENIFKRKRVPVLSYDSGSLAQNR